MNRRSLSAILFLFSTLALSSSLAAQTAEKPSTIQAQGHGEVRAAADTVSVSISVDSAAPTAAAAAEANAAEVAKVTDAVKAKVGNRGTIVKASYMLNPQYDSAPSQPAGFTADEQIRVTFPTGMFTSEQAAKLTDAIASDFLNLQAPSDFAKSQGTYDSDGQTNLVYEVRSTASTAAEAVRLNESRSAKVLQEIKAALGDRAKVDSSSSVGSGVVPVAVPGGAQRPSTPSRYSAHSDLVVESKQLDLLPELMRIATGIGAARVNSATFLLRDRASAQKQAIADATKDAESKAQSECAALGVHLGPLLNSTVDIAPTAPVGGIGAGVAASSLSVRTQPTDINVYANVVLTYAVQ